MTVPGRQLHFPLARGCYGGQHSFPVMSAVIVRVPASLSNLGPGFDCLGIALRLYNVIRVEVAAKQAELPDVFTAAASLFFKGTRSRRFPFSCSVSRNV